MHGNDEARRTGGLTTEDLAQPSGAATTGSPQETEEVSSGAPIYPGESTATTKTQSPADNEREGSTSSDSDATADTTGSPGTTDAPGMPDTSDSSVDEAPQLLTQGEDRDFRNRWQEIQNKFVDDPREAVHDADTLVADVMQTLATTFAQHKKDLEDQWGQGKQVDTEELRRALRRYRSFFNRLLST
ncbi:hypothetical protein ABZ864_48650 [Streptomyces sp. NPDC047082]|uniref:hypothetical protein n=1 Tax=Streptomyces sp. NPDC047082 TaxID=3155259 RepID=UPI003407C3EB